MTRQDEREILAQFTQEIARKIPGNAGYYSIKLFKLAVRHQKACENSCNYGKIQYDLAIERIENRIKDLLHEMPSLPIYFQRDPRGWTVKIGSMIRAEELSVWT